MYKNNWVSILKFIPSPMISAFAYFAALILTIPLRKHSSSIEARVRGLLLGPRFDATGLSVGRDVVFIGEKQIKIGKNVSLHAGCQIIAGSNGHVIIGDYSHISRNSIIAGSGGIIIGQHCKISSGVIMYTVTYDRTSLGKLRDAPVIFTPIEIGDDAHIGANATILGPVKIGNNSIVGACALVNKFVPDDTTVVGIPAKSIAR